MKFCNNRQKLSLDLSDYFAQGFNKSQATSLAWAAIFEQRQVEVEYKYQGRVDGTIRVATWCETCKCGGDFMPDSVRLFIHAHKGHKTRTVKIR